MSTHAGEGRPDSYGQVARAVWRYCDARGEPSRDAGHTGLLDPSWQRKREQGGVLAVEGPGRFGVPATAEHALSPGGEGLSLTSVQVHYDNFAIARVDSRAATDVLILTLFRIGGDWSVAGETFASGRSGRVEKRFNPRTATDEVLAVMDVYYRAVELGRPDDLGPILADGWHMKNPESGRLAVEGKQRFIRRIAGGPLPGYYDDRQVADVQVVYDHLAVVRVDNPATRSTTVFTYMRLDGEWLMVDKSWSERDG